MQQIQVFSKMYQMAVYQMYGKFTEYFRSNKSIYSNQIDNILQGYAVVEYKRANEKDE